ncbi:Uncharacterised protein [Vibrio cholerae]|nr:Uncharacterised protein [Vibrio cholerae]CSI56760.1 Uncharacterised protein [Vibrio cholerae]CSI79625.1 Uncharacterised protein [Vibrio cholerae]
MCSLHILTWEVDVHRFSPRFLLLIIQHGA